MLLPTDEVQVGDESLLIDWSDEGTLHVQGTPYNAFQRYTTIARVTWNDGRTVAVVLPDGTRPVYATYLDQVLAAAQAVRDGDPGNEQVAVLA